MALFRSTELIVLFQMNNHFASLQAFTLFLAYRSLFYVHYIKIINNGGW